LAYTPNRNWTLRANVINVTNERMPFTPTIPLGNTYWYSPAGRMLSLSVHHKF
jgi:outer membrane receptor protein involved in Fe transport